MTKKRVTKEMCFGAWTQCEEDDRDFYEILSDQTGLDEKEVKRQVLALAYGMPIDQLS